VARPRTAAPKPRTRIQREKQDIILEAALEMFSQHGFRGATIDQIAEVAGMSKPNLLYYFPSKEEIHPPPADPSCSTPGWPRLREIDADRRPLHRTPLLHPPQARNGTRFSAREPALRQ
jgi:TetR/AcrR family transcriptional regulator